MFWRSLIQLMQSRAEPHRICHRGQSTGTVPPPDSSQIVILRLPQVPHVWTMEIGRLSSAWPPSSFQEDLPPWHNSLKVQSVQVEPIYMPDDVRHPDPFDPNTPRRFLIHPPTCTRSNCPGDKFVLPLIYPNERERGRKFPGDHSLGRTPNHNRGRDTTATMAVHHQGRSHHPNRLKAVKKRAWPRR